MLRAAKSSEGTCFRVLAASQCQGDTQRTQGKFQALHVSGQQGRSPYADQPATHPVGLKGQLHADQPPIRPFLLGDSGDGVGFVDHGIHGVRLRHRVLHDMQRERQAVEDVPELNQERRQGDGRQRGRSYHHPDEEELQRPGESGYGQGRSNPPGQSGLDNEQAESDAQWKHAEPGRQRIT